MPARPQARRRSDLSSLQPDFLAQRAVEADERAPRARGCSGAEEVQRRGTAAPAARVSRGADGLRALSREVAPAPRLEGHALQHLLRRGVQRAPAPARAAVRLAPARILHEMSPPTLVKAHAFGNDFVLIDEREVPRGVDGATLARAVCDRHRGLGADGLMIYGPTLGGASMRLLNADG